MYGWIFPARIKHRRLKYVGAGFPRPQSETSEIEVCRGGFSPPAI